MARWWTHRFFVFDVRGKHLLLSLTYFVVWKCRKPSISGPKVFANKQDLMHASTAPEISEALGRKRVFWAWLAAGSRA